MKKKTLKVILVLQMFYFYRLLQKSYPLDSDPPTKFLNDLQLVEGASTINDLCFSG